MEKYENHTAISENMLSEEKMERVQHRFVLKGNEQDATLIEASTEIERRIHVSPKDNELRDLGGQLQVTFDKLGDELNGTVREGNSIAFGRLPKPTPERAGVIKEDRQTIGEELLKIESQRGELFVVENPDLFYGVPEQALDSLSQPHSYGPLSYGKLGMKEISTLLALPYHLQKMREDRVTDIVASATSSVPYCILLKELDVLLHPEEQQIKYVLLSTKAKGEGLEQQNAKLLNYFRNRSDARIGAFDECASSNEHSGYNTRPTVSIVADIIEELAQTQVVGRYGVDAMFPTFVSGKEVSLDTRGYGDESKGVGLFAMINLLSETPLEDKVRLKLFDSLERWEIQKMIDTIGYERKEHGQQGLEIIKKLKMLADIAYRNFTHNSDAIWNPFNNKIRRVVDSSFR